jgi:hypothetical protein
MQNGLPFPPLRASAIEDKTQFNIVIAYEDFETGKLAKNTADFLVEHLDPDFQFNNQMWKFEVLTIPKLRELAAKDAATADIIIIATHGIHDLPRDVKAWLEMAFEEGIHAIGMVALFDEHSAMDNPARSYLEALAEGANLEFFSQPASTARPNDGITARTESSTTLSILASYSDNGRNISHWGINE